MEEGNNFYINLCSQRPYVLDQWNPGSGLLRWTCKRCDWSWSSVGKASGMWKAVSEYQTSIDVYFSDTFHLQSQKLISHYSVLHLITNLCTLQEHRTEIDARAGTFQAFEQFGQQLLARGHYASPEIKEKLDILDQERTDLEKAWVQRRMMLDQCLELQVLCCIFKKKDNFFFHKNAFIHNDEGCSWSVFLMLWSFSSLAVSSGLWTSWKLDGCPRGVPKYRRQRRLLRQCGGTHQEAWRFR